MSCEQLHIVTYILYSRNQLFYCCHLEGYKVCYYIYMLFFIPLSSLHLSGCRHAVQTVNQLDIGYKQWAMGINCSVVFTFRVIYVASVTQLSVFIVHFMWSLISYQNALMQSLTHIMARNKVLMIGEYA